jgi:hypothetical protein
MQKKKLDSQQVVRKPLLHSYVNVRSSELSAQSGRAAFGPSQPIGECPLTGLGTQKRKVWNPPIADLQKTVIA